jgi:aminoglycoside phosphotransferase (APT) family kinase protein
MHGDFTPWNLRQMTDGALSLVDWEDAAWAPPLADLVYYQAAAGALHGRIPRWTAEHDEARSFWSNRLSTSAQEAQAASDEDLRFKLALLATIRAV